MNGFIYLASPYTSDSENTRKERVDLAARAVALLMQDEYVVYSPIVHGHHLPDLPLSWEFWQRQCFGMLRKADALMVLRLEGWEDSVGVKAEIEYATELGIPVLFADLYQREESE